MTPQPEQATTPTSGPTPASAATPTSASTPAPLVSVVMPVYNAMPYLRETLESLLTQTLEPGQLEIIAVNDGSTDGSGEMLDDFAAQHSNLFVVHQPNSGWPGAPRNRGLDLARGTYVFFMDADDTLAPDALEQMTSTAVARGAEIVMPRMAGVNGRAVQGFYSNRPSGTLPLQVALETLSPQKLFASALIEQLGLRFAEGKVRLEDGIFVTEAYVHASRIELCGKEPLYFIRLRDDQQNISSQDIEPKGYVNSLRAISQIIRSGVSAQRQANSLILDLFVRKGLRFYRPERWSLLTAEEQELWVTTHRQFLADEVPKGLERSLKQPSDSQLIALIRANRIDEISRHVEALDSLTHTSSADYAKVVADTLELRINTQPLDTPHSSNAAVVTPDITLPHPTRLRIAESLHTFLAPTQRLKLFRAASRRVENLIVGSQPTLFIVVTARTRNKRHMIRARWAGNTSGTPRYRVLIPLELFQGKKGEVIDIWTVRESPDGIFGRLVRVAAEPAVDGVSWSSGRVYTTNAGNISVKL